MEMNIKSAINNIILPVCYSMYTYKTILLKNRITMLLSIKIGAFAAANTDIDAFFRKCQ